MQRNARALRPALILKKTYYVGYSIVLYFMVYSTKTSFFFLFDKWAQMTLFGVDLSKDLFFLFLLDKRARTVPVRGGLRSSLIGFDRVSALAMRVPDRARFDPFG